LAKTEVVRLAPEKINVEYDEKGDALYIAFSPESVVDDSELTENDIILRYNGDRIIGLTILHFSERQKRNAS
jgi:uncharacterized protein YuzE